MDPFQLQWRYNVLRVIIKRRKRTAKKRWWVRPIFEARRRQGDYCNLLQEMRISDSESFFNYFRMSTEMFDELLAIVGPEITKVSVTREAISPGERLSVTLRYLAAGDSMTSMSYQFRLGKTTVSNIIKETTHAIWDTLSKTVFLTPTEGNWESISIDFWKRWNFPNCLGAIDGKHVVMQAPSNAGSAYYNYKGTHSLVLLAACDAKYSFTVVDVGGAGRQSDGGTFRNSLFGRTLEAESLNLPPPIELPGTDKKTPYVFVADEAFPLKKYLMRPYPGQRLEDKRTIFNYRLSRARRVIENAFGILSARMRIFRRPILGSVANIEALIKAAVCLHNWILRNEVRNSRRAIYCPPGYADFENADGILQPGQWRNEIAEDGAIQNIGRISSNSYSRDADYFMGRGQIPWQWEKL